MKNTLNLCKHALEYGGTIKPLIIPSNETKHMGITNPSIIRYKDRWLGCLRNVEYALYHSEIERDPDVDRENFPCIWGPLIYMNPEDDVNLRTTNFMIDMDDDFTITNYCKTDTSQFDKKPLWSFIGLEDARLVEWEGKVYQCGVRRDTTTNGEGRMELSTIEENENGEWVETNRVRIQAPDSRTHAEGGPYCEKNWMPVLDMPYHYVKWTIPTEVVKVDPDQGTSETVAFVEQPEFTNQTWRGVRGDSQIIKYKDYYVALTHEVDLFRNHEDQKDTYYWHKFIVWDKDWKIKYMSDEFRLTTARVEFSCGMSFDGENFVIPFGFVDHTAFIFTLPSDVFEVMVGMKEEKDLPKPKKPKQKGLLVDFIMNPTDSEICWDIAENYFNDGHYASSMGFYLRAADYTKDDDLRYNARYMVTKSLSKVGHRDNWEEGMWWKVIDTDPERPEAYVALIRYYDWRYNFRLAYQVAKMALEKCTKWDIPITSNSDYSSRGEIEWKKHKYGTSIGYYEDKRIFLKEAIKNLNLYEDPWREEIKKEAFNWAGYLNDNLNFKLSYRPQEQPFPKYTGHSDHERLRRSFTDAHVINNHSSAFEDIFVLSLLDGNKEGKYLDITDGYSLKENNTFLLEQLGWDGVSLVNDTELQNFRAERKCKSLVYDKPVHEFINWLKDDYDYLSINLNDKDSDPFNCLQEIPWERLTFKIITFRHNDYLDHRYTKKMSRDYLKSKGYQLLVSDISPTYSLNKPNVSFEDWWIHPSHFPKNVLEVMKDLSKGPKNPINYIFNINDGAIHTKDLRDKWMNNRVAWW